MLADVDPWAPSVAVQQIRDDMCIRLYVSIPEFQLGAPTLRECPHTEDGDGDCVETIICPCGEEHVVVTTAYGWRGQCDELDVRWTSMDADTVQVGRIEVRCWTAEPYDTMATRTTK